MSRETIDRTGEIGINTFGTKMKIVKYISYNDIIVEFMDLHMARVNTRYSHFKSGKIKNPFDKSVYDIGYIGVGEFGGSSNKNRKIYNTWNNMLKRCYDKVYQEKFPSYVGCTVCEEWHNFQNFAKWFIENYYEIPNDNMSLDKDILYKRNKIYSPKTCCFIPQRINSIFVKRDSCRGEFNIGVHFDKERGKYIAQISVYIYDYGESKIINLGYFTSEYEAFVAYKNYKEKYIKYVADYFKEYIPHNVNMAMCNYNVEMED